MKKLLIITISILLTTAGYSTPPLRRTFQYRQSDGTMITATKSGNSDIGFYETTDGMAIGRKDGSFYYLINVDGDAIVSGFLAHDPSSRDAAEVAFVRQNGLRGSDLIQQSLMQMVLAPTERALPAQYAVRVRWHFPSLWWDLQTNSFRRQQRAKRFNACIAKKATTTSLTP